VLVAAAAGAAAARVGQAPATHTLAASRATAKSKRFFDMFISSYVKFSRTYEIMIYSKPCAQAGGQSLPRLNS
jgi:hypothetical protein